MIGTASSKSSSAAPLVGGAGRNILHGTRISVDLRFGMIPLGSWRMRLTEENFGGDIDGFKNGPVRAIRGTRQSIDFGKFIPAVSGGTVYSHFYASSFTTPSEIDIPWIALKALRSMEYEGVSEFPYAGDEVRYWDGANPQGVRVGDATAVAQIDRGTDHEWWAVSGPGGTCLHTFLIPDAWQRDGVVRGSVLRLADGGSEAGDETFQVGYSLRGMENLSSAGRFQLDMTMFVLSEPFSPGDQQQPLAMSA